MDTDEHILTQRRAICSIASALLGWLCYGLVEAGTKDLFVGGMIQIVYLFCIYLLLPFTFSAMLLAIVEYIENRVCGRYGANLASVILLFTALVLAVCVTIFAMRELATVIITVVFLAYRLFRTYL